METEFSHLHVHSVEGSLLDGAASLNDIAEVCDRQGMRSVAITEHGNLHSLFAFEKTMKSMGITPNAGQEFYMTLDSPDAEKKRRDNFHLTILAMNTEGYKNLTTLSSLAYLYNSHYNPRITLNWLEEYGKGLFVLSGCISSYINQSILAATWSKPDVGRDSGDRQRENTGIQFGEIDKAEEVFRWFVERFPARFAVEIMNHGFEMETHVIPYLLQFAEKYDIPVVATNDVHYAQEQDAETQNTLLAITTGGGVGGKNAGLEGVPNAWLKTGDEMERAFDGWIDLDNTRQSRYLSNSLVIAEQCTFERPKPHSLLPKFPVPEGYTIETYLRHELQQGIFRKYPDSKGNKQHPAWNRVKYEYEVVCDSGFASYFLVVSDFVRYAKEQGILVGPGRGSAAGSLMAYALDITSVDPLQYGLLFERFLNPERKSMPDIDIDFQDNRREEVIQYVANKYGHDYVAHIATFSQMGPKGAINDAARVLGIPFSDALSFSNLFFKREEITEEDFTNSEVSKAFQHNPELRKVLEVAMKLQGKRRQAGTHASAIVISEEPIINYVAMMKTKNMNDGLNQLQIDMHESEEYFLKMDFLGLSTLTLISEAVSLIREIEPDFDIQNVSLDDNDVYDMLSRGEVFGVFQLGESAARRVTNILKPRSVEDIAIISAMCRPGPVDNLDTYVARKEGKEEWSLLHPDLEPVIGETFGFPIFQDQVMLMARVLADYSLGEADSLRKAMGKKLPAEMALQHDRFVNGCVKKGIDRADATALFEDLAKFSGYGFNKAHSTCYSLISYWTAWLSYHYPQIFLASLLTSEANDRKKIPPVIAEIRRRGIELLPPHVNESKEHCTVEGNGIRIGLSLVKGIGAVASKIVNKAPYFSIDDFIKNTNTNIAGVSALIAVGACDDFSVLGNEGRAALTLYATEFSKEWHSYKTRKRLYDLKVKEGKTPRKAIKEMPSLEMDNSITWLQSEKLMAEMDAIGCYLSSSPLLWLAKNDTRYTPLSNFSHLEPEMITKDDPIFSYVLEVRDLSKVMFTKKDKRPMIRVTVGDAEGTTMEMVLFPDVYATVSKDIALGQYLSGYARLSGYGGSVGLVGASVKILPLSLVEEMQNSKDEYHRRDSLSVHVIPPNASERASLVMESYLFQILSREELLGDIPIYVYHDEEHAKRMTFGTSSANRLMQAVNGTVMRRMSTGPVPAYWDGERFVFEKIESKDTSVQLNPKFRESTYRELGGRYDAN